MSLLQSIATIIACLAVVAVLKIVEKYLSKPSATEMPYAQRDSLLSQAERSFLGVLELVLPDDWRAFAQVRLADLLSIQKPRRTPGYIAAFNRVASKHVDFVICATRHLRIVGVIELDDRSHENERAQKRDSVKDAALRAAGIPVLRIKTKRSYSTQELRDRLREAFSDQEVKSPHDYY